MQEEHEVMVAVDSRGVFGGGLGRAVGPLDCSAAGCVVLVLQCCAGACIKSVMPGSTAATADPACMRLMRPVIWSSTNLVGLQIHEQATRGFRSVEAVHTLVLVDLVKVLGRLQATHPCPDCIQHSL